MNLQLDLIAILLNIYYEDKVHLRQTDYKTNTIQLSNMLKYYVLTDTSKKQDYIEISIERPCIYEYIIIATKIEGHYTKLLLFTKAQFLSYINEYYFEKKKSNWFSKKCTYTFSKLYLIDRASWLS